MGEQLGNGLADALRSLADTHPVVWPVAGSTTLDTISKLGPLAVVIAAVITGAVALVALRINLTNHRETLEHDRAERRQEVPQAMVDDGLVVLEATSAKMRELRIRMRGSQLWIPGDTDEDDFKELEAKLRLLSARFAVLEGQHSAAAVLPIEVVRALIHVENLAKKQDMVWNDPSNPAMPPLHFRTATGGVIEMATAFRVAARTLIAPVSNANPTCRQRVKNRFRRAHRQPDAP